MNDTVKHQLTERANKLEERLRAVREDRSQPHSRDWDEQAQERENDDVLTSLKFETEAELASVKKALLRIDSGEYGICTECHNPIQEARLKAIPEAELCIECQTHADRYIKFVYSPMALSFSNT